MWKLQQLLFLGTRRREIEVKKMGDAVLLCGSSGHSWRLGGAGHVRRSSKKRRGVEGWRLRMPKGPREPGEIAEQDQDEPGQVARVRRQLGPLRGGPTWQSIMVSSSFNSIFFSPVSAHSSASRTGPSGRPPSFFRGASQSGDKAMVGSSGEDVPGGFLKSPGRGASGKRLSHTRPATRLKDAIIHRGKDAETPGKAQPDTQTRSEGDTARPSLTPGCKRRDRYSTRGHMGDTD